MEVLTGLVGNGRGGVADGTQQMLRLGKTGEQIVGASHGNYFEAALRGNLFIASQQAGVTLAAALRVDPGALAWYNPANSGVNLALYWAGYIASVAFAAASQISLGLNTNPLAAAVTGTAATVRNCLLGGPTPKTLAYVAPTLPAIPVAGPILGVGLTGAITTVPGMAAIGRDLKGSIIVPPGCAVSFQGSTASGASGFWGEMIGEEIPII